jgi:nucleoside-diphosphate-sugar epimerase
MASALIGHTGFVGGNLKSQLRFDHFYNSQDIETIAGKSFDLVVSAGAPAVKWLANQKPAEDKAAIDRLRGALELVRAKHFVLISTVDVYPTPIDVDERTPIDTAKLQPYGLHRLELERWIASRYSSHTIVRLPALFGPGLKKNVIYDFLHDNRLDLVHQDGVFQFYPLARIGHDVETARKAGLGTVNFAVEPIAVREIARVVRGGEFSNTLPAPAPRYDFKTVHGRSFGASGPYLHGRDVVLAELRAFTAGAKAGAS